MSKEASLDLEVTVIDELAKLGLSLSQELFGNWHWLQKEIQYKGKKYLIGAHMKRCEITRALEIYGQECLLKQ